ncbi:MAG: chemotaxis protein CheX [Spirochaetota bacterium]|nr:chemotaxis protein CheX [Spirochaetota bacterium]
MLIDYINPFVESAFEIMSEILNTSISRQQLQLKKLGDGMKGFTVIIGVTGAVYGRIVFDMTEETALALAGKLNDEHFIEVNDLVRGTISEIGNMVTARAVTKLSKESKFFNFSPPTLIVGNHITIFESDNIEALIIPIDTSLGIIDINIALKN